MHQHSKKQSHLQIFPLTDGRENKKTQSTWSKSKIIIIFIITGERKQIKNIFNLMVKLFTHIWLKHMIQTEKSKKRQESK